MSLNIALTGNIGSGKTTVCHIFQAMQIPVYYSDDKAKLFLNDDRVQVAIRSRFGDAVFGSGNAINNKALAAIVFGDAEALNFLNNLIHPLVINDYHNWLVSVNDAPYTILESAIIFENNLEHLFDKLIYVYCPQEIRMKRIIQRDNTTQDLVQKRFDSQLSDDEKMKRSDIIIYNDDSQALIPQVLQIDAELKSGGKL
jgi:dephospho-CoA kinase